MPELLGSLGPSISAVMLTFILKGKTEVKTLLKKYISLEGKFRVVVNCPLWLVAFVFHSGCSFKNNRHSASSLGFLYSLINIPVLLFFIQMPFFVGMLGEEVGWRGFALPRGIQILPNLLPRFSL